MPTKKPSGNKKTETQKVERYNIPWVAERVWQYGFEEKVVRNYFHKIISMVGEDVEHFKDHNNKIWFDKELAELLVWVFQHLNKDFLRKTLDDDGEGITPEDALLFQRELLTYVDTIDGPLRPYLKAIANKMAIEQSQALFQRTLANARELSELFQHVPAQDRIELLERLNPAMEAWKEDLKKRIKTES